MSFESLGGGFRGASESTSANPPHARHARKEAGNSEPTSAQAGRGQQSPAWAGIACAVLVCFPASLTCCCTARMRSPMEYATQYASSMWLAEANRDMAGAIGDWEAAGLVRVADYAQWGRERAASGDRGRRGGDAKTRGRVGITTIGRRRTTGSRKNEGAKISRSFNSFSRGKCAQGRTTSARG